MRPVPSCVRGDERGDGQQGRRPEPELEGAHADPDAPEECFLTTAAVSAMKTRSGMGIAAMAANVSRSPGVEPRMR